MKIKITLKRNEKLLSATVNAGTIRGCAEQKLRAHSRIEAVDMFLRVFANGTAIADETRAVVTRPESKVLEDPIMCHVYLGALLDSIIHKAMHDWSEMLRR